MVEELNRLNCENKRLNETLTNMCENYEAMQKHLSQLMNQDFENQTQQSRKRKFGIKGININNECSNVTDDESLIKRSCRDVSSPNKAYKVLFKTEAFNNSLVSFL